MDMKSDNFHRRSLTFTFLKWLFIFSLTVLIILLGVYVAATSWLTQIFKRPNVSAFLQNNKSFLYAEDFDSAFRNKMKGCEFVVLDGDRNTVYTSTRDVKTSFTQFELQCILDYSSKRYFTVSRLEEYGDQDAYLVTERFRKNGEEVIGKYCVLDKNYHVLWGPLFSDIKNLSDVEFQFINGQYNQQYNIAKYSYVNNFNQQRILIFYYPRSVRHQAADGVATWNQIWYFFIPLFLMVVALFGFLISREMKRYLQPINAALARLPSGDSSNLQNYQGPRELMEIASTFDQVTTQLQEIERQKQELDEQRRQMLMDISHDLKTPITVIQGYAKAICDGMIPDDSIGRYVELIYQKATSVSDLTEAFLEYSAITRPDFGLETKKCDLCEFLKEYFGHKYNELEEGGFSLVVEIPEEPAFCQLDIPKFRRILDNIVNNSIRYNPEGTEIFCGVTREDDFVLLTLGDKGVGIPAEICTTIFDPFVPGDASRGPGGGHGLGMTIVKKLVEAHGGTVQLIYPPEHGLHTQFLLHLPLDPHEFDAKEPI